MENDGIKINVVTFIFMTILLVKLQNSLKFLRIGSYQLL